MPTKKSIETTALVVPNTSKVEAALTARMKPLLDVALSLQVISTQEQYDEASLTLSRFTTAEKAVDAEMDPIIRPANEVLQGLYSLRRKLMGPIEGGKKAIKAAMRSYQLRIEDERRAAAEVARKLREEAEEKEAAAEEARTKSMQTRLKHQAVALQERATVVEMPVAPVRSAGSSVRKIVKWELMDIADVIIAVVDGKVDPEILMIDPVFMNALIKKNRAKAEKIPGIRVYDDVTIAGR